MVGVPGGGTADGTKRFFDGIEEERQEAIEASPMPEVRQANWWEQLMGGGIARNLSGADEQTINLATNLGATEQQLSTLNDALTIAATSGDSRTVQTMMAGMVADKTPAEFLDALEKTDPNSKAVLDAVRENPALMNSIHNAASKDITVLEGLNTLTGENSAIGSQDDVLAAIKDPTTSNIIATMLNKTAEDPNLKFNDVARVLGAGIALNADKTNEEKQKKWKEGLAEFGANDPRLAMSDFWNDLMTGDIWETLKEILDDPAGFAEKVMQAMNIPRGGIADGIGYGLGQAVGSFTEDESIRKVTDQLMDFGPAALEEGMSIMDGTSVRDPLPTTRPNGVIDTSTLEGGTGPQTNFRPTSHFNLGGLNITPTVTPEQERALAEYDAVTQQMREQQEQRLRYSNNAAAPVTP